MDITEKRREDTRRLIHNLLNELPKGDLDQLNTTFRSIQYLRDCLRNGKQPREYGQA